jgi:hypothetical protein
MLREQEAGSTKYLVTTTNIHKAQCVKKGNLSPESDYLEKPIFQFSGCIITRPESDYSEEKTHFPILRLCCSISQKQAPQNVTLALVLGFTIT